MKSFMKIYPISFFLFFASLTIYPQNQSINSQLPSSFYGKWYSTDGNNLWGFHITQDFFRTNNTHFKYLQVFKDVGYYTVEIGLGTERRTYLLKEVHPGYLLISGTDRNFKLYKNNPNKSNTYSPSLVSKTENVYHDNVSDNRIRENQSSELSNSTSLYIMRTSWEYGFCNDKDRDGYKSICCLMIDIRARKLDKFSPDKYSGYYKFYFKKSYESDYHLLFTSETYTNISTSTFGFFRCASIGYGTFPLKHGEYDFRIELFDEKGLLQEVRDASMDKNLNNQKFELFYGIGRGEE